MSDHQPADPIINAVNPHRLRVASRRRRKAALKWTTRWEDAEEQNGRLDVIWHVRRSTSSTIATRRLFLHGYSRESAAAIGTANISICRRVRPNETGLFSVNRPAKKRHGNPFHWPGDGRWISRRLFGLNRGVVHSLIGCTDIKSSK